MIRLFRVFVPASTFGLFVFESLLTLSAYVFAAYLLLEVDPTDYLSQLPGISSIALVWFSILLGIYLQGLYSQVRVRSRLLLLQQLLMVAGVAFLLQALVSAIAPDLQVPLRVMLFGSLLSIAGVMAGRLLFSVYLLPLVAGERLLLIGNSPLLQDIARHLERNPQTGVRVVGHLDGACLQQAVPAGTGAGAQAEGLEQSIQQLRPNRVVVGFEGDLSARLAHELLELRFGGHAIEDAAGTYAKICSREGLNGLNAARLIFSREFAPGARSLFFQAAGNSLIAAVLLIVLAPLFLLIAVLVRWSSPGGVIDRRLHQGRGGPFTLLRFRVDAGGGRVGRLLARTGLYALPQLVHVVRGQMSLVGPRPARPEFGDELSRFLPFYPHRLKVRPGMTGWSQIQMRHAAVPPDAMMELECDLYYIKYFSPTLDMFIVSQAIKNLLLWGGQP